MMSSNPGSGSLSTSSSSLKQTPVGISITNPQDELAKAYLISRLAFYLYSIFEPISNEKREEKVTAASSKILISDPTELPPLAYELINAYFSKNLKENYKRRGPVCKTLLPKPPKKSTGQLAEMKTEVHHPENNVYKLSSLSGDVEKYKAIVGGKVIIPYFLYDPYSLTRVANLESDIRNFMDKGYKDIEIYLFPSNAINMSEDKNHPAKETLLDQWLKKQNLIKLTEQGKLEINSQVTNSSFNNIKITFLNEESLEKDDFYKKVKEDLMKIINENEVIKSKLRGEIQNILGRNKKIEISTVPIVESMPEKPAPIMQPKPREEILPEKKQEIEEEEKKAEQEQLFDAKNFVEMGVAFFYAVMNKLIETHNSPPVEPGKIFEWAGTFYGNAFPIFWDQKNKKSSISFRQNNPAALENRKKP